MGFQEELNDVLSRVDLSSKSTTKFQELNAFLHRVFELADGYNVYSSTISTGMGNVLTRMNQMKITPKNHRKTRLFIGVMNDLDGVRVSTVPKREAEKAIASGELPNLKGTIFLEKVHGAWTIARACIDSGELDLIELVNRFSPAAVLDKVEKTNVENGPKNTPEYDNSDLLDKLYNYSNVILEGPAGIGKSHLIKQVASNFEESKVVVFHPSTGYEDFVEGLRPKGGAFEVMDGTFLSFCRRAAAIGSVNPSAKFLFVVDEINRANTAKVLGDLLLSIEKSKRVSPLVANQILSAEFANPDLDSADWVELQNERGQGEDRFRQRFVVPSNLYILGTMNTSDRSVGSFDLALRRRFVSIRMEPMPSGDLKAAVSAEFLNTHIDSWAELNSRLKARIGVDALLGHSYFFDQIEIGDETGRSLWGDQILPQLAEILVTFNALNLVDELLADLETGGMVLQIYGSGLDSYPVVEERNRV